MLKVMLEAVEKRVINFGFGQVTCDRECRESAEEAETTQ
jgi:hypothetical protein